VTGTSAIDGGALPADTKYVHSIARRRIEARWKMQMTA
jgi:hypothetical protein